jgi:ribosomal protein S12 methylthiotransferase accessory factor
VSAIGEVHRLVGPFSGITWPPQPAPGFYRPRWLHNYLSGTAPVTYRRPYPRVTGRASGSGVSYDRERAWRIAVIESLERIATASVSTEFVQGDAHSVPGAIDLEDIPRCSEAELADPSCALERPDNKASIRWATGVDLADGSPARVPAVMVYLDLPAGEGERFWRQISTGAAAGPTWEAAIASAVCEAVERDIVAVTWLQKLPLPRLAPSKLSESTRDLLAWCRRKYIEVHFFDATSEIGVPTVYCVQEAPHDTVSRLVVSAATDPDGARAAEHALVEGLALRPTLHQAAADERRAVSVLKGALAIGSPRMSGAMDFLLRTPDHLRTKRMPPLPAPSTGSEDGKERMHRVIDACTRAGHKVYAFDLTTPDLRTIGLHVARVVIPSLQPLSFSPHARYLGHPRVYQLPGLLGHRSLTEGGLNSDPQPFA